MKLDTIPNDSATTISRNKVSFNMCESEDKDRLSTIIAKKISNASNVKVNGNSYSYKNNRVQKILEMPKSK